MLPSFPVSQFCPWWRGLASCSTHKQPLQLQLWGGGGALKAPDHGSIATLVADHPIMPGFVPGRQTSILALNAMAELLARTLPS